MAVLDYVARPASPKRRTIVTPSRVGIVPFCSRMVFPSVTDGGECVGRVLKAGRSFDSDRSSMASDVSVLSVFELVYACYVMQTSSNGCQLADCRLLVRHLTRPKFGGRRVEYVPGCSPW